MKNRISKNNAPHKLVLMAIFFMVIVIWSTTPVAIKWSGEGVSYLFGIFLRMSIGTVLAFILVFIKYKQLPMDKASREVYLASAVSIFGGMMPVYWGAQYISSGLISVIFGLMPIITGYLAWRFVGEQGFNKLKIMGSTIGVAGLVVIFYEDGRINDNYIYGISSVLLAVVLHSISAVWIRRIKTRLPALTLVAGGLLFAMPLFIVSYAMFAPPLPQTIPSKAIWSIVYLGVVGSIFGFVGYYYLLKHVQASSVALITLITPVSALWLGHTINNEIISISIYIGSAFILTGLVLHQGKGLISFKSWR